MNLDLTKLVNLKTKFDGWEAACPVCRANGNDKSGNHLSIWKSGKFSCVVHPGDKQHNKQIYQYLYKGEDIETEEVEEFVYRGTKLKYYPEELLSKLIPDYSYWEGRNIPSNIVSQFPGGLSSIQDSGKLSGRYVFAIRNKDNKIVGWAGRLIEYSEFASKWKNLGIKKSFIFPERKLSEKYIRERKQIVILESVGDALACYKYGIKNTIVLFGVVPSSQQISYIISLGVKEIIISTNNDSAKNNVGNEAAEKIKKQLCLFFNPENIKIILPQSKDFGESNEQEILDFKKKIDGGEN